MIEIPEANVLAAQLNGAVRGKKIKTAVANASPHKFSWYYGDPADYGELLEGRVLQSAGAFGGRVELEAGGVTLMLADGVNPRFYTADEAVPKKHQLFLGFEDGSFICCTVAMYGGIWAFPHGAFDDDFYYRAAKEAIPALSEAFSREYFLSLLTDKSRKLSAKAFLATEQRIPGLGNGVLQDILLNARLHPKRKMNTLSDEELDSLFELMKATLKEMTALGGRDTERDLFGEAGGYKTKLSKLNAALICPHCGGPVTKQSYLGGSVYFCGECQRL
jgi:formamidopyrimidine-DNA glycosylase